MMNKKETFRIIGVLVFTIFTTFLSAQSDAKEVTSTHFIKNANVVQKPGMVLPITNVLIKNGIIEAIGPNVTAPFDANIIDADSMYVYAGFIDAGSHTGIPKKEANRQRPEGVKPANPPNSVAGITPEAMAVDVISPKEKSIADMRTNGFVISHVLPTGRMLPGKGAIISNHGTAINDMVINGESSMFSQFTGAPRVYPATIIGIMAKWRDLYNNSKNMNAYAVKYALNPTGKNRPNMDAATEAMGSVVTKDLAVYFKANKAMDAHRALQLQKDLGFNIVLTEVEQAYPLVDLISSENIHVLLSAKLPKADKKDEKKDEKKEDDEKAEKKDLEKEGLMMRKKETATQYLQQAGMLEKKGVKFAFSFLDSKAKDFKASVRRMIENGLSEDGALAAMTTNAADLIGISRQAGTVEKGKMASLVITDKPYFDEKSNIHYVIVDGKVQKMEVKEKKKKKEGDGEPADAAGSWAYEIEIPGQTQTGTIVVSKNGDDLEIKFNSADDPDDYTDGNNIELDGSNLTFEAVVDNDGFSMSVSFDIELDGESFEGTVEVAQFGSFPIKADKIGKPE